MLKELLDKYTYLTDDEGKPYTPRKTFEDSYALIVKDGLEVYAGLYYEDMKEEKQDFLSQYADTDKSIEEVALDVVENTLLVLTDATVSPVN